MLANRYPGYFLCLSARPAQGILDNGAPIVAQSNNQDVLVGIRAVIDHRTGVNYVRIATHFQWLTQQIRRN